MTMPIDEFFRRAKTDAAFAGKSRLLVVRNRQEQTELRKLFEERPAQFAWVRVSKSISGETFVPSADVILADVRNEVAAANASGRTAYVTGISAMLSLWDFVQRMAAFERLKEMLDSPDLDFFAMVNDWCDEAKQVFFHPRYIEGKAILSVGVRTDESPAPEIRLVSKDIGKFMDGTILPSLSAFVNDYEIGGFDSRPMNVCMASYKQELACVGGAVRQVFREGDFLRLFCGYQCGLGESAERWLFMKMADAGVRSAAKDFAQKLFFQGDMDKVSREAPRMVIGCSGEEQEVLVWVLRQSVSPDSYLGKVLNDPAFVVDRFKSCYVNEALLFVGETNWKMLCAERRDGIAVMLNDGISLEAEMSDFVERAKEIDSCQIVPWLANGTKPEIFECARRLREADLKTLPPAFYDAWPELRDYLSAYALGDAALEKYFTEYRILKIANTITPEFCNIAKEVQYPIIGVKSRDDLLNDAALSDAILIVVDAMGIEYMPMILSIAERHGLGIANAVPALAKIPTSTRFNRIEWPEDRRMDVIPELDNIIHNGAHLHGRSTDEENFVAELETVSHIVMSAVARALARSRKVVLTADHGASRLAVLANKSNLSATLPVRGVAESAADWRYLAADPNTVPPKGVASNLSGDWWIVKGYDRFSKPGGKLNELHGGLTCEEVLVPFVVFEKGATFVPSAAVAAPKEQMVENDDFDL